MKKKVITSYGDVEVSKNHCLAPVGKQGFRVSEYLQDLACYVGQQLSFDEASENLLKVGGIILSDKQVERICHHYGEILDESIYTDPIEPKDEQQHYAMMDGSMCFLREEKWKEVKLGRIFLAKDMLEIKKRGSIRTSDYVAHLGSHEAFLAKFETRISNKTNLVAIADGARWIWGFWSENYPQAIQILDFYHAIEKIENWAKLAFKDEKQAKNWITLQETRLLNDQILELIEDIETIEKKSTTVQKQALLTYLNNNKHRMMYKTYLDKGLLIGSRPMESANRQVIQQRLKKSGQRWSKSGLQQIANLRVARHSDRWNLVTDKIKKAA